MDKAAAEDARAGKNAWKALDTPMLDVATRTGQIFSFSYSYLVRVDFDPEDKMTLHFGEDKVVVEGRNLKEMRDKLRRHQMDEIREGNDPDGISLPDSATHIDHIGFEFKEQEKEKNRDDRTAKGAFRR